ncbi:KPN_02809 family neutral zinc metallopeptidase [Flavisolibacter ginsenosidimutans]|uniref:Metalloprotease n=1 Tax=Flavisolibacter ginsenosidimutans TaxID=661481 RepID=A0A5B8UKI7_9BACT|nr:neutral zinc metallopeptidase [Flavisolibacter ginsenosidimutans]QEC57194.1 metalloprotease [Flavisolibacter ginsenosidimutans]
MRWQGQEESGNVEDRRGIGGGHIAVGGGIIGVIVLLFNLFTGNNVDPSQLPMGNGQQSTQLSPDQKAAQDDQAKLSRVVLRSTEKVWAQQLPQQVNVAYTNPILVLFNDATQSGCGGASSATGPFYCPADQKLYLDLSFFDMLSNRFHAAGDFAKAYVIAHEVGHHIQYLLGTSDKMDRLRQRLSEEEYNKYSVKLELQADFFAGVWAHYAQGQGLLEAGDMESALKAAQAIGDDQLQKEAQGYAVPESFTHGTSAQRMFWLKKGFETGDIKQGDTFNDPGLQ